MREIEFRGKCIDTNEWWAYGVPVKTQLNCCDNGVELVEGAIDFEPDSGFPRFAYSVNVVDENTIGQYTGLKDKNGKKIFEGDFIKARHNDELYKVHWELFRFIIEDKYGNMILPVQKAIDRFECEVIGNIYDNPEMLKGEEKC